MADGGGSGARLKRLKGRVGHVSKKQQMKKRNNRKKRQDFLGGLAATYHDESANDGDEVGTMRHSGAAAPSDGGELVDTEGKPYSRKRRRGELAGRPAARTVAAPVAAVVISAQTNWQRLQQTLKSSAGASRGRPIPEDDRRGPAPKPEPGSKGEAKAKRAQLRKAGPPELSVEMGEEYAMRCVGLDCEMVGVGPDGKESMLARVALVCFALLAYS